MRIPILDQRVFIKLPRVAGRLLALAAAALLVSMSPAAATEGPFLKLTGRTGTAYLFGSVHFGTESIYPLSASVEAAFAGADRLAVEVNLRSIDSAGLVGWMAEHGVYNNGSGLNENVSAETWALLERRAGEYGIPVAAFSVQRAWLVAFTMTALALVEQGYREELGIDRHFLNQAAGRKPVIELESVEAQLSILSGLPPAVEEHFLNVTLKDLDRDQGNFMELLQAWRRGDAAAIAVQTERLREGPYGEILFQRLIEARNVQMARRISALLEAGGTTFVVVGAAHLVGPRGIAALLESRGYRLEKP